MIVPLLLISVSLAMAPILIDGFSSTISKTVSTFRVCFTSIPHLSLCGITDPVSNNLVCTSEIVDDSGRLPYNLKYSSAAVEALPWYLRER